MVKIPVFFGVICPKVPTSMLKINSVRESNAKISEQLGEQVSRRDFDEDETLASWSCGMNGFDLSGEVENLKSLGLLENVDFVITSGCGPAVPWLSYSKETNEMSFLHHEESLLRKNVRTSVRNFFQRFFG